MFGYKVKHNLSDKFMFYPNIDKPIIRLYDFNTMLQNRFDIQGITPFVLNSNKLYKINQ